MTQKISLIPLLDAPIIERDWVKKLLAPAQVEFAPYSTTIPVFPGAIYVFRTDQRLDLPSDFLEQVSKAGCCGLFHLGDEYYRGDYSQYRHFDFVVRIVDYTPLNIPGVMNLPVGYTNNVPALPVKRASERKFIWMFAGDEKADRTLMARRFKHIPNGFLDLTRKYNGEVGISRQDYIATVADSVFAPSPAGNIILEACRTYEALELGAIPIVPKRRTYDTYREVLGDHPIPTFESWSKAREFVLDISKTPQRMDALQAACTEWWHATNSKLSSDLRSFIEHGLSGQMSGTLSSGIEHADFGPLARYKALLKQQNVEQLIVRARNTVLFGARKLLTGNKGNGDWSYKED